MNYQWWSFRLLLFNFGWTLIKGLTDKISWLWNLNLNLLPLKSNIVLYAPISITLLTFGPKKQKTAMNSMIILCVFIKVCQLLKTNYLYLWKDLDLIPLYSDNGYNSGGRSCLPENHNLFSLRVDIRTQSSRVFWPSPWF